MRRIRPRTSAEAGAWCRFALIRNSHAAKRAPRVVRAYIALRKQAGNLRERLYWRERRAHERRNG